MKKVYSIGMIVGIIIILLAVPLGDLYWNFYLSIVGGMETERFTMLIQSAIVSFQIIGGIILLLCGISHILKDK